MATGPLPSLHWNLWDYYIRPSGNYFSAKMGSQVEHIAYNYIRRTVWLINRSLGRSGNRRVDVQIINTAGKILHSGSLDVTTTPNSSNNITSLSSVLGHHTEEEVVFLKLVLTDRDTVLSRNVYWIAKKTDLLDWASSDWRHTPITEFSDFTPLNKLLAAIVEMSVAGNIRDGEAAVTLENLSSIPAVFISLSAINADGHEVLPLTWSDNYVTLWPGEKLTLALKTLKGAGPGFITAVRMLGKNVEEVGTCSPITKGYVLLLETTDSSLSPY